jgi:hypothetical protein
LMGTQVRAVREEAKEPPTAKSIGSVEKGG